MYFNFLASASKVLAEENLNYFDRLPVELLDNIFQFLDFEALKECSLVNKLCSKIVTGSRRSLLRFTLHVDGYKHSSKDLQEIFNSNRRYKKIRVIRSKPQNNGIIFAGLEKIGWAAEEVHVEHFAVPSRKQLFTCFPNVIKLSLNECYEEETEIFRICELPKLKHLILGSNKVSLEDIEDVHNIAQNLNLTTLDLEYNEENAKFLARFLQNQSSLDTLRLSVVEILFNLELDSDFRVRRLFVHDISRSLFAFNLTLKFAGKIEILFYSGPLEEEGLLQLLQSFNMIKALTIKNLSPNESFYEQATINTELTELVIESIIHDGLEKISVILGAFQIFPNLKKLSIKVSSHRISLTPQQVDLLQEKLQKLEKFSIEMVCKYKQTLEYMKYFRNITDLYINLVWGPIEFALLKEACKNLKFFSIKDEFGENLTNEVDFTKVFENFPNLATLQLDQNIFNMKLINCIRTEGKQMKFLNVRKTSNKIVQSAYQLADNLEIRGLIIQRFLDEKNLGILYKSIFKLETNEYELFKSKGVVYDLREI